MTVIAYRNGVLAADSQLSDGDGNKIANCFKIKKVKGWLLGAAGDFAPTEAFMAKFDPQSILKKQYVPIYAGAPRDGEEFESMVVSPSGRIYEVSTSGIFGPIKSYGYYAIGCGSLIAFGAMAAGADAVGAVKAAIRHSTSCGGRVQKIKL